MSFTPPTLLDEINAAAVAAEVTLLFTCTVMQYSQVPDGKGGRTDSWTSVGTMPCRLVEWRSDQPANVGEELKARNDYMMVFFPMNHPLGDALKLRDRLIINDTTKDVCTIEIQAVETLGTWGILNRIYGVKV